jgi:cell division protein FtsQ
MRNWKYILERVLWSLAGIALIVLFAFTWRAKSTKKCAGIHIELKGNAPGMVFIDEKEILKLIHEQGVKVGTPIGEINLNKIEQSLLKTNWVNKSNLFIDNLQQLQVVIEQRIPIARVFTASGNSFYIDSVAQRLPLRQLSAVRLPVFTNFPSDQEKLSKPDSTLLKNILQFASIVQKDSFFMAQIAQVNIASSGDFEIVPTLGDHLVLIGSIEHLEDKLNRLYTFYKKVWVPSGINAYEVLDARFDHQIVALKKGMQPLQYSNGMMPMIKIDSLAEANKNADATQPLVAIASLGDSAQKKASLSLDLLKKALDTTPKKKQDTISKNKGVNKKVVDNKQPIKGEKKPDPKPLVKGEKKVVTKGDKKPKEVKKPQPEKKQEKVKKTTIKENNKVTNKTLNNTKKSAKAEMPKQSNSNNN